MKITDRIKQAITLYIDQNENAICLLSDLESILFRVAFHKETGKIKRVVMNPTSETDYRQEEKR